MGGGIVPLMRSIDGWPKLDSDAQVRPVGHNGEPVSADLLTEIAAAGGAVASSAEWVDEAAPGGFYLSDEEIDWIKAAGNSEYE